MRLAGLMLGSLSRTRGAAVLLALVFVSAPATAQERRTTIAEWWETAHLQGARSGYVHTIIEEIDQDGVKIHRSVIELRLSVKRFKDVIQLAMDNGTYELPEGKVFGTFMKQMVGKGKSLEIVGTVEGKRLTLTRDKTTVLSPTPWDPDVLGVSKQKTLFKDRKVKPGDAFSYKSFEPTINVVVTTHVEVKDEEEVELFGGKQKRRLLRVDAKAEKVGNFQLPPYTAWLDDNLMPVRSQTDVPGLGNVTLYQAPKAIALAPSDAPPKLNLGISNYVRLNRKIARPHETTAAVYRITLKGEEEIGSAFAKFAGQEVKNANGSTMELHVRRNDGEGPSAEPSAEFTQSSYFITSADQKVQDLAREAVGNEKEPWKKARKIEKWVHNHVKVRSHESLAPADHVARTLVGDCTEFAMLTAAMCRAEGIPSKTAMGLIYADVDGGPVFAFHMWTEVWIEGRWQSLDATLGLGHIGAAHLKISDQSWHDGSLTPFLSVARVLGRLTIEVVRVEGK